MRVSDAFDLRMGKTPSRKNPAFWRNGTNDWVSIADLGAFGKYVGQTKERINELAIMESGIKPAPADTVLMSFKLSLGKASITTVPTYTNEAIMAFVDKGVYPVDSGFLYHQCRAKDWTADTNTAVMGKTLNKKALGQAMVFLPELTKQQEIAATLDFLESRVDGAREQISKFDALVKSRFVEMFGGAEDIDARWCSRALKDCVESLDSGKSPSCQNVARKGLGPGVLKLSALSSGLFLPDENKAMLAGETVTPGKEVKRGDILIARKNTPELVGSCVLVRDDVVNLMFPDIVFRMHPNDDMDGEYLSSLLAGPSYSGKVKVLAHGSNKSMSNIPKTELAKLQVPVPPLALQQEFAAFAAEVDKSRFAIEQGIEKLHRYNEILVMHVNRVKGDSL